MQKLIIKGRRELIGKISISGSKNATLPILAASILSNRTIIKNVPLVKQWVSIDKDEHFMYPLIHSTPKKGIQYRYSSVCDKGHFGIPKVIFGEGGIHHCIVDVKGEYGMTHGAMAIQVNNIEEGNLLRTILLSETFKKLLKNF